MLVHWCGHDGEVIPIPDADGVCDLVPVLGLGSACRRCQGRRVQSEPETDMNGCVARAAPAAPSSLPPDALSATG